MTARKALGTGGGNRVDLKDYWLHGEGLAKWTTWTQLYHHLKKHVADEYAKRIAASWYHERYGRWPGAHHGKGRAASAAGEAAMAPPAEWFTDPKLHGPTAVTVTADGRVYGHIAAFGVPHLGMDEHTEAPRSRSGYRYFRSGAVLCADGSQVPVGHLTLGTGHAAMDAGVTAAAEHYDNTGTAVADVAVGEDAYGIWCAGAVRPGATDEQVHALRASGISGDWRSIDGELELVAALAVNVPGFPVPRMVAASGVPVALVAAGAVASAPSGRPNTDERTDPMTTVTFTAEQLATMRQKLGVNDPNADAAAITAALVEALDEQVPEAPAAPAGGTSPAGAAAQPAPPAAGPAPSAGAQAPAAAPAVPETQPLPDGVVTIDATVLAELRAQAAQGAAARAQQEEEQRLALVSSAVQEGRIAPARRDHWLQQLKADPGAATVLASLAAGTVPVDAPRGHDAAAEQPVGDDYWFPGFAAPSSTVREG